MGVWIEIAAAREEPWATKVAPFMGVWIEIEAGKEKLHLAGSRTLHGCVDWNVGVQYNDPFLFESHPSWVCGLKLGPSRQCRQKVSRRTLHGCVDWNDIGDMRNMEREMSHPSWVCGLKCTNTRHYRDSKQGSHPSWVCGLKLISRWRCGKGRRVAPFMGAWIEIPSVPDITCCAFSRTLHGCVDWNAVVTVLPTPPFRSHPSWVRGLK